VKRSDGDRELSALDDLARLLIARATPVRLEVARSPDAVRAAFELRYETVVEQGWGKPAAFPDGLEHDAYDAESVHVLGWDGPTLVANARLVFPAPGRQLPTEAEFGLVVEPQHRVVDIGRAIVRKEYRSNEHALFGALLAQCWIEVRRRGLQDLCGTAAGWRLERYRQFGLPLRIIGSARDYWGEARYPVFLSGQEFGEFAIRCRPDKRPEEADTYRDGRLVLRKLEELTAVIGRLTRSG
jgi:predicted GNAT family N-acyltransferase